MDSFWMFGVVMAVIVVIIIIGGIKFIVWVIDKIVLFMVGIYVLGVIVVLAYYYVDIFVVFGEIIGGVFNLDVFYGGFIGVLI